MASSLRFPYVFPLFSLLLCLGIAGCSDDSGVPPVVAGGTPAPVGGTPPPSPPPPPLPGPAASKIGHVFIVILENETSSVTFGPMSPAPYLSKTLPAMGAYLQNYYGIAHNSNGNYTAMISGQGVNIDQQADCQVYSDFITTTAATAPNGQFVGQGCVFPTGVRSLPDQLEAAKLSWKGYFEDMGNDPARDTATCARPALNGQDKTQTATATDQYAARHNPFIYFHSIIDDQARCDAHVVSIKPLDADLAAIEKTPNFSLIVPNLCHDAHDATCVSGETPGGLGAADNYLKTLVPKILASPAFQKDGLLIITFDESSGFAGNQADSSACCGETVGPNTPFPGITGLGGGKTGAVLLSPFILPGTVSTTDYNHYSLLKTLEDIFGLPYLGYAGQAGLSEFGTEVCTNRSRGCLP
ncbi:MAG: hypothetical protein NVS9B10_06710 [Nevskia sp.]